MFNSHYGISLQARGEGPRGLRFLCATLSPLPSSSSYVFLSVEVIPHTILHFLASKKFKVVIINLVNPVLEFSKGSGMNKIEVSVS